MYLSFPNYDEFSRNPNLAKNQEDKVWKLLCEKFEKMNNNPKLKIEDFQKNIIIYGTWTKFYDSNEFCVVNFATSFFDYTITISVRLYFNQHGKYIEWNLYYEDSSKDQKMMNFLEINHFNDSDSRLSFSLNSDKINKTVYEIIKENYIKTPEYPNTKTIIKYCFDVNHKVYLRRFESKTNNSRLIYSLEGFEKFETELMFLKFVKHVIIERDFADSVFVNYKDIDFRQSEWIGEVNKQFLRNLTGDKQTAFLDYMNVIDMMAI